jgi:hypothetical protein
MGAKAQPFEDFKVTPLRKDLHHYRNAFDSKFLRFTALEGSAHVCRIIKVEELLSSNKNDSKMQLLITLDKFEKPWAINITNSDTIGMLHGVDPHGWPGKRVELYPTKTKFGRDVVDCIRVREQVPADEPVKQKPQADRPELSPMATRHLEAMRAAKAPADLDAAEDALAEDNSLSPEETARLVKSLAKHRERVGVPA